MKSFVSATIADMLKMRSANRFAVVSYSTEAQVEFDFNDVQGTNARAAKYAKLVQSIPHHRGLSFIDKALIVANESVFTEAAGMTLGASQVEYAQERGWGKLRFPEYERGVVSFRSVTYGVWYHLKRCSRRNAQYIFLATKLVSFIGLHARKS